MLILVFLLALGARALYLAEFVKSPFFTNFFLDSLWHHQWALAISKGTAHNDVFFRAPLYPYFLGGVYWLFGANPLAARAAQFTLGSISACLAYVLARQTLGGTAKPLFAAIAFALYGPMIYFEGELLIPALIVFLDLLALVLFVAGIGAGASGAGDSKAEEDAGGGADAGADEAAGMPGSLPRRSALLGASGLAFGLSAIARPNVLAPALALGLYAAWLVYRSRRSVSGEAPRRGLFRAEISVLLFVAGVFVFPLAVTVRNGVVGGDYVFIASQGGVNFYIGNNEDADGKTATRTGKLVAGGDQYKDSVWLNSIVDAENETGKKMRASEVSRFWYKKALAWIAEDPAGAAGLYGRKLFYLIHGHEIPSNNIAYFARRYSRALSLLLWDRGLAFPAGLLIPLGLAGAALRARKGGGYHVLILFSAAYAATIVMFFVTGRYRMPLVAPFIILAAGALAQAKDWAARKKWARLFALAASVVALAIVSNADAFGVRDDHMDRAYVEVGNFHYGRGEYGAAVENYREALKINEKSEEALSNLGTIAFMSGRYDRAIEYYSRALLLNDGNPVLYYNLGLAYRFVGDLGRAERCFARALELDPEYKNAAMHLGNIRNETREE